MSAQTRISVELVPRDVASVQQDVRAVDEHLGSVDTINIPDLIRFGLRSWDACATARAMPRAGERPAYRTIPHLRSQDLDPSATLPMARALDAAGIDEVLVVTGDPPSDFSWRTYDVDAVDAIRRLRRELPHLHVYGAVDPYRQSMVSELEYAERKLDAGAAGLFTQPFFDLALMQAWAAVLPVDAPTWWGATTVTTPGSMTYWRRRNRVVFPATFEPTLAWQRELARAAVGFARERGQHVYLMPVRCSVVDFLDGIV